MLGERIHEPPLRRRREADPVAAMDEDLPLDATMESAPLRAPRTRGAPSPGRLHQGTRLVAMVSGGAGAILLVGTYVAFLGGIAGMPHWVTMALDLSWIAEALLITSAPFAIIAWGSNR